MVLCLVAMDVAPEGTIWVDLNIFYVSFRVSQDGSRGPIYLLKPARSKPFRMAWIHGLDIYIYMFNLLSMHWNGQMGSKVVLNTFLTDNSTENRGTYPRIM